MFNKNLSKTPTNASGRPRSRVQRWFVLSDAVILCLVASVLYGLFALGRDWQAGFNPVTEIDLSVSALPRYTFFSLCRGLGAYFVSLTFTLIFGYWAAKSKRAERVILPAMDILQSIPVSAFLPGLFLGMISLFPHSNVGLELAAVLSIFTSQAWNMSFGYYNSLKSIPTDLVEVSSVMGLSKRQRLLKLELPFAATNLAWNSLLSMAGGWFFLSLCESFWIGDQQVLLPGLGAYIAVATEKDDTRAVLLGIAAMMFLILALDQIVWRPLLGWVGKFRLEDTLGIESKGQDQPTELLMNFLMRESRIVNWFKAWRREFIERRLEALPKTQSAKSTESPESLRPLDRLRIIAEPIPKVVKSREFKTTFSGFVLGLSVGVLGWGAYKYLRLLVHVDGSTWLFLARDTAFTLLRILAALLICTAWAVPAGIWIGLSPKRIRFFQPIIQIVASFPAPTLFPLVVGALIWLGIPLSVGSILLLVLGVQWYVLFNVLSGALRISRELDDSLLLMNCSRKDRWFKLFLPSVFPSLLGGWVNAAGGAWNASIVAEYVTYKGRVLTTSGLGASIRRATDEANFSVLAAGVAIMVTVVILFNRTLWAMLYRLAQTRYKLEV